MSICFVTCALCLLADALAQSGQGAQDDVSVMQMNMRQSQPDAKPESDNETATTNAAPEEEKRKECEAKGKEIGKKMYLKWKEEKGKEGIQSEVLDITAQVQQEMKPAIEKAIAKCMGVEEAPAEALDGAVKTAADNVEKEGNIIRQAAVDDAMSAQKELDAAARESVAVDSSAAAAKLQLEAAQATKKAAAAKAAATEHKVKAKAEQLAVDVERIENAAAAVDASVQSLEDRRNNLKQAQDMAASAEEELLGLKGDADSLRDAAEKAKGLAKAGRSVANDSNKALAAERSQLEDLSRNAEEVAANLRRTDPGAQGGEVDPLVQAANDQVRIGEERVRSQETVAASNTKSADAAEKRAAAQEAVAEAEAEKVKLQEKVIKAFDVLVTADSQSVSAAQDKKMGAEQVVQFATKSRDNKKVELAIAEQENNIATNQMAAADNATRAASDNVKVAEYTSGVVSGRKVLQADAAANQAQTAKRTLGEDAGIDSGLGDELQQAIKDEVANETAATNNMEEPEPAKPESDGAPAEAAGSTDTPRSETAPAIPKSDGGQGAPAEAAGSTER